MAALSSIVMTRDEEIHVERAIRSVVSLGPVFVVDAESADRTRELAEAAGAAVVAHAWEGYAAQKNWALRHLPLASEWVLFLDADEYLTEAGRAEIERALASPGCDGYTVPRLYIFLGRPLRHAWWYPDRQLRLFRASRGRFEERRVHEHVVVDGVVGELREPLHHENRKGLSAFIERHNRYSDLEADELTEPSSGQLRGTLLGGPLERRRWLKQRVWYRLPGRPLLRFLWLFVVRRGFLDGRRGFVFCCLIAIQEFHINAKLAERRLAAGGTL